MDNIYKNLNDKQLKAVEAPMGASLVIAGAGSGKTAVLSYRIAYLITKIGLNPKKILAFTFTNKASNEMKSRIVSILNDIAPNWINTFHGFCLRVLREDIHNINRENNFAIIDEDDQMHIVKDIYNKFAIDHKTISPKLCLQYINNFKSVQIDYDYEELKTTIINIDADNTFNPNKIETIIKVFQDYQTYLLTHNLVDFNDLIKLTVKLFSEHKQVLNKWQSRFDYILVDEFQDTNEDQFFIIKSLSSVQKNIFVVGDPDQMIYTWRGAYANIFSDFESFFENSQMYLLEKNYRSTKKIINLSNALIANNKNRVAKVLFTDNEIGNNIIYYNASNQDRESKWVVDKINFLISKGYDYKDIAILYRSNFLSRNIEQELIRNSIPYFIFGGFKFYQRKEIKDVIAYLKLICSNDDISFSRIYNTPRRKISDATFTKLREFSYTKNLSLFEVLEHLDEIQLSDTVKETCNQFKNLIDTFKANKYKSLTNLLDDVLAKTGYLEMLKNDEEEARIENINELKNAIAQFELLNPNSTLNQYLQEISLFTSLDDDNKQNRNFVSLMTVHLAKGLEFKNVFLIEFNEGIFPSNKSIISQQIEEERRLAYVAMTRSREHLFVTSADGMMIQSDTTIKKTPSRFISEISHLEYFEIVEDKFKALYEPGYKNNWFDSKKSELNLADFYHDQEQNFVEGDVVVHEIFGQGVVLSVGDKTLEISFKFPHGVKTLMKNHKSIVRKLS